MFKSYILANVAAVIGNIGKLDGITCALVGDHAYGKTIGSLAYLLNKYNDAIIYFFSPSVVKMKVHIL
ncbi:hypothetical protein R6Q57_007472 [Mikania cordata]